MSHEKLAFNMIAAYSVPGRVLGDSTSPSGLPWGRSIKGDLVHFAELTTGNTLIVGANTLPYVEGLHDPSGIRRKRNVIVLRSPSRPIETPCIVMPTLKGALELTHRDPARFGEAFVAGGAQTYASALEGLRQNRFQHLGSAAVFYATEIYGAFDGDTFMPELGEGWAETDRWPQPGTPGGPAYDFVTYKYN